MYFYYYDYYTTTTTANTVTKPVFVLICELVLSDCSERTLKCKSG